MVEYVPVVIGAVPVVPVLLYVPVAPVAPVLLYVPVAPVVLLYVPVVPVPLSLLVGVVPLLVVVDEYVDDVGVVVLCALAVPSANSPKASSDTFFITIMFVELTHNR